MTHTQAIARLAEIHSEFPFAEGQLNHLLREYHGDTSAIPAAAWPRSYRVHLAAMVVTACSAILPLGANRLGIAYNAGANMQRSGKTLLCQIALGTVWGITAPRTFPVNDRHRPDESEIRKVLDGTAQEGRPYIIFDNVKGLVSSEALEAFMTSHVWNGRVLGNNSKTFTAEHSTQVFLTGNDIKLSTDNRARFLICDLNVEEAEAQDRHVQHIIEKQWIAVHQPELLECTLALMHRWVEVGSPKATGKIRRGFESWCWIIGGILEANGLGDPFETRSEDSLSATPDDDEVRKLVKHFAATLTPYHPSKAWNFTETVEHCREAALLDRHISEGKESEGVFKLTEKARSQFGKFLVRYFPIERGRIWHFPEEKKHHPYARTIRMQSEGEGRSRRYVAKLELQPADLIKARVHASGRTLADFNQLLHEQTGLHLHELDPDGLDTILKLWDQTFKPHFPPPAEEDGP